MVQKTRLMTLLGLGVALVGAAANAQMAPITPGAPGTQSMAAPGAVDNRASSTTGATGGNGMAGSSTTITSTDMTTTDTLGVSDAAPLRETGGEPWLMALAGVAVAAGALSLRRRLS